MTDIPSAVLSEQFLERMSGRKLVAAIFTTFRFEPGFFESEVLPVFLDIPLSHAPSIKLVQLEDALRPLAGKIAVYYDQHGLVANGGPAKLDVRRYPVRHGQAIFHPKNVLALVEELEPDESGHHTRALLCSSASANLTRAGWWENVEGIHIEEIAEGERSSLRDALVAYVNDLVSSVEGQRANEQLRMDHGAAHEIHSFLHPIAQRSNRSADGRLFPHFHSGDEPLVDFIEGVAGKALRGFCLEVISPYFDRSAVSKPLLELMERFEPAEVRVFLPRNDAGDALCSAELFDWVKSHERVQWGKLPKKLLQLGQSEDAKDRSVHAKVYRFFDPKKGGREILYVGSANLTSPAFQRADGGGNWETGFLVEATSGSTPDFWLSTETKRPPVFTPRDEDDAVTSGGTKLVIRYDWASSQGCVVWEGRSPSPALTVRHGGVAKLELADLPPSTKVLLDAQQNSILEKTLLSTSLLEVTGEGAEPGLLLVQEEGMHARPSLVLDLSAADILHYWSLLTVEQRATFIEARAKIAGDDDPLLAKLAPLPVERTLFDRFAGIFHAFECLGDRVREALGPKKPRKSEADYRLFGKKYDSLGSLLDRVLKDIESGSGDHVEQYVVTLCARQLLSGLGKEFPEYWAERRNDVKSLETRLADASKLREALCRENPEMPAFLEWFDDLFLRRSKPVSEEEL